MNLDYDNSYHVVVVEGTGGITVLDGFAIFDGKANGSSAPYDRGGGLYSGAKNDLVLANVFFNSNEAVFGGGLFVSGGSAALTNATFNSNHASFTGGGIFSGGNTSLTLTNVTFENSQALRGGAIYNTTGSSSTLTNVTLSRGVANSGAALYDVDGGSTIENSILFRQNESPGGEIGTASGSISVSYSIVRGGYPGVGNLDTDPRLEILYDYGGTVDTYQLPVDSPAIDAANAASCPAQDARGVKRPQGAGCGMGAYELGDIRLLIRWDFGYGDHGLEPGQSTRRNPFPHTGGPVKIFHTGGAPLIAAERVIYRINGVETSFSEMIGLPNNQLDSLYWFPWYNNSWSPTSMWGSGLQTQFRFARP